MAVTQAQGTINMETFTITFTQGGSGEIGIGNPAEVIGQEYVTGDLVSFEYDDSLVIEARMASNIQQEEELEEPTEEGGECDADGRPRRRLDREGRGGRGRGRG